jgi:hypothetical protein
LGISDHTLSMQEACDYQIEQKQKEKILHIMFINCTYRSSIPQ